MKIRMQMGVALAVRGSIQRWMLHKAVAPTATVICMTLTSTCIVPKFNASRTTNTAVIEPATANKMRMIQAT